MTRKVRLELLGHSMALPFASLSGVMAHRQHCPPTCYRAEPRQEGVARECSRFIARGSPPSFSTPPPGCFPCWQVRVLLALVRTW